ncbi:hypothetical protein Pfo_011160 [Paulownia fortunei]|nr:hypothetical protein Pfo_011160 [Paulownia fortunei]
MRSNDGNSKRPQPSAPKRTKSLTLFEDLLNNPNTENLHSRTNLADQRQKGISLSDCGRGVFTTNNEQTFWLSKGFIRVTDGDGMHEFIKTKLVSSLRPCGIDAQIETIYRNGYSSEMSQAKLQSFNIFSLAVQKKCHGDAKIKYAWYAASKDVINGIVSYGFGLLLNNGVYGHGVYLSSIDHPIGSLQSSTPDQNGLRHMLLCRVILGNVEVIGPGSRQCNPSSESYDSGVDNPVYPKKYIIWNGQMNTHILPEFVISFKTSLYNRGFLGISQPSRVPNSDWNPLDILVNDLSMRIPAAASELLFKHYNYYINKKIEKREFIQRMRYVVGDNLLATTIKSHMEKIKASGSNTTQAAN